MTKWVKFWDKIVNRALRIEIPRSNCGLVVGQKRTGKSTFFVPIADYYKSIGYKVFCNFPMSGCYSIPLIKKFDKKSGKEIDTIDKDWLFDTDLSYSCVLLDEAEQIWGSRDFSTSWTQRDTNWFTELGKNHTIVYMITQYFDLIDLNCKRSCDCQIFLTRSPFFKNVSFCDFSELASLPIIDKMEVVQIKGAKGFVHETWAVCARHYKNCRLYRRPFYNKFVTEFSMKEKDIFDFADVVKWNDILNFYGSENNWLSLMFDDIWVYLIRKFNTE